MPYFVILIESINKKGKNGQILALNNGRITLASKVCFNKYKGGSPKKVICAPYRVAHVCIMEGASCAMDQVTFRKTFMEPYSMYFLGVGALG